MTKLNIDGTEIDVPADYTLLQACEEAGVEIPRFCYHERLSVAGNCRMCLVEVKGGPPKPVASCALGVRDIRPGPNGEAPIVLTRSPMVKKAREGTMEFLLINHPLDCPICDQGGECDLQDQAMAFGVDSSRFAENKRAVEDKDIGPLVRTSMNRCIHCTRCVRFTAEVAGTGDMGAIGRGEDMEITTYLETAMGSELQGNVADLCPVGALLPKPYKFKARPWELAKTDGIDVMDALGSAIRIDTRSREVMRILPRINDAVNEEWISDKARQSVDGLKRRRLDRPFVRRQGRLVPVSWPEAFAAIAAKVKATAPERIGALAGDLCAVEEMFALQSLMTRLGVTSLDCHQDGSALHPRHGRASYILNSTVAGLEEADAIMIIGSNPRREAPVLNARIRKRWLKGNLLVGLVGAQADITYPYTYLGAGPETLAGFVDHAPAKKERPMLLLGQGALARPDGAAVLGLAAKAATALGCVKDGWLGFGVLHTAAARVGGLDLGFVPGAGGLAAPAMVAAAGLDVTTTKGRMVIDIGGGTTEIAVLALSGVVAMHSIKIGGDTFDAAIQARLRNDERFAVGTLTAERLKIERGYAGRAPGREPLLIAGTDLNRNLPMRRAVAEEAAGEAMRDAIEAIVSRGLVDSRGDPARHGGRLDGDRHHPHRRRRTDSGTRRRVKCPNERPDNGRGTSRFSRWPVVPVKFLHRQACSNTCVRMPTG